MDHAKARELREKRAALVKEAQKLMDAPFTAETRTKFDTMMADADLMKGDIDRLERADAVDQESRNNPPNPRPGNNPDAVAHVRQFRAALRRRDPRDRRAALERVPAEVRSTVEGLHAQYWNAQKAYLIGGEAGLSPEARAILGGQHEEFRELGVISVNDAMARSARGALELRDMTTGGGNALQGSGGGYFVPVGFVDEVEEAMKWYGDMLQAGTIMETATGQPLPYPTDNDTTNSGELVGEGVQVTTQDVSIGNVVFGAYKFSTKMIKVSLELLQDSAFDLESYVKEKFGVRLGRSLNTYFTTGTGTGQPTGIITAATAGPTATGAATNDGGVETGGTSIGTDDLTELEHSIDKAYRRGSAFMGNDSTIKTLKKLKDKYGRPIWLPGIAVQAPDTILGYPYFTNNDMAAIAVNAKTLLFGQLKKYMIRQVKELAVVRLSERYADYGQVAFIGFARYDGNLLDAGTHPVKYLVQAAS